MALRGLICICSYGNPQIRAETGTFSLVMDSDIEKTELAWLSKLSWQNVLIGLGGTAIVAKLVTTKRSKQAYWALTSNILS